MFYLFILESIGTPELLMIGTVALIVFGPRKLPEMMRTIGRAVAEFRRSSDDFSISIPATAEVSKIVEVKTETNSADKRNWL
jgi:TatA/E family protein of Tat protein translocase